jgi:hypothetical protein
MTRAGPRVPRREATKTRPGCLRLRSSSFPFCAVRSTVHADIGTVPPAPVLYHYATRYAEEDVVAVLVQRYFGTASPALSRGGETPNGPPRNAEERPGQPMSPLLCRGERRSCKVPRPQSCPAKGATSTNAGHIQDARGQRVAACKSGRPLLCEIFYVRTDARTAQHIQQKGTVVHTGGVLSRDMGSVRTSLGRQLITCNKCVEYWSSISDFRGLSLP